MRVYIKTLGCDKNTVDSEYMLGLLRLRGHTFTDNPYDSDVIVVNTCSFILDAKLESIDCITEYAAIKVDRPDLILIVVGCLSERYPDELLDELPEIDAVMGASNFMDVAKVIDDVVASKERLNLTGDIDRVFEAEVDRVLTTPKHFAYLKIAEGCDNRCSYCIIPKLKGKFRSRKLDVLVKEARVLAKSGVKELILIAQDVSRYGLDFDDGTDLSKFLIELDKIEELEWIRLHYLYPDIIDEHLLYTIQKSKRVIPYFDLPFQHISDRVLKRMNRNIDAKSIKDLVVKIRNIVDNAVIRTTFIVGFPSETEEDFAELLDFVTEYKLDRVGVFKFSSEEGTPSYKMPDKVSEEVMEHRYLSIMLTQEEISESLQQKRLGSIERVIVEELEGDFYIARSYRDAPDIDGICFIRADMDLTIGAYYNVEIIETSIYDVVGRVV